MNDRARTEARLRAAWSRRGWLAAALWPVSKLYGGLLALRRGLYASGLLRVQRLPVPVVVIGNVVAGGAGKTPTTLAVVQHLASAGWRPGIVSRGHGRQTTDCRPVALDADPRDVGDEPLLLRRQTGVPVFVAGRRAEAGRALLAAHPEVNVLVCDDGLQHRALARDVEVCVFDARGAGNGWLLPAGPLREPWPRPVDLVLYTEGGKDATPADPTPAQAAPAFTAQRTLTPHAVAMDGRQVPLAALRGQALVALAGIARPEAFFAMLRAEGLTLQRTIALPDHYDFESYASPVDAGQTLICTEKDAIKLWRHAPDVLAVPLQLTIPPAFFHALDEALARAAAGYHGRGIDPAPEPPASENNP